MSGERDFDEQVNQLIVELADLHKQATRERSHYYVGSRTQYAAQALLLQAGLIRELSKACRLHDEYLSQHNSVPDSKALSAEAAEAWTASKAALALLNGASHD